MAAYGLIGHPLGHSVSPQIHQQLFSLEGLSCPYELYDLPAETFAEGFPAELEALDGFNITLPFKEKILPYLETLHESAAFYGSANTVLRQKDGTLIGFNTDCDGFLRTLESRQIPISGSVCILGAGGVGRMFALECLRQGAKTAVAVRETGLSRAKQLAQEAQEKCGKPLEILDIGTLSGPFDLLINATPAGMYPNIQQCPISETVITQCKAVFDCIYNPGETLLLQAAKKAGAQVAGGMDMLVWQAVSAHHYWNGTAFSNHAVQKIISETAETVRMQFGGE